MIGFFLEHFEVFYVYILEKMDQINVRCWYSYGNVTTILKDNLWHNIQFCDFYGLDKCWKMLKGVYNVLHFIIQLFFPSAGTVNVLKFRTVVAFHKSLDKQGKEEAVWSKSSQFTFLTIILWVPVRTDNLNFGKFRTFAMIKLQIPDFFFISQRKYILLVLKKYPNERFILSSTLMLQR